MNTIDFSRRNTLSELMDADDTDFQTFRDCLVDLGKVNRLTLAFRPTLGFFRRLERSGLLPRDRAISIVDVGAGSGDMLRQLELWGRSRGFRLDLIGVDLNPWSGKTARQLTNAESRIRYETLNIFDYRPVNKIDVVISSLFTHHLDNDSVVKFLRWMEAEAQIGWFINDLQRHPIAYHLFRHAARTLGFHHFVQHDGPVSIARAFSAADWQDLLRAANVFDASIESYFPFRLCVSRTKPR